MAKRKAQPKRRQKRRTHSEEFKRESVKLLEEQQLSISQVSRNLDIHVNLLRKWKQQYGSDVEEPELTEDERMEIARLRAENKRLRMERDILKKVAPGKSGKGECVMTS